MSGSREPARLEDLWAGDFGDRYLERNRDADSGGRDFWAAQLEALDVGSALEVGCNFGGNLRWIAELLGADNVAGVDVNEKALELLRERVPGVDARACPPGPHCPSKTAPSTWCSRWEC